jgi:hypothetical protein
MEDPPMTLFTSLSTLVVGLSVVLTGCSDPDMNAGARGIDLPTYSTLTGTPGGGNGGTNNYAPPDLAALTNLIYESTCTSLTGDENVHDLAQWSPAYFIDSYGKPGASTLDYMSRCALGVGDWISTYENTTGYGQGILKDTSEWKSQGLPLKAKEDLFSCLMAHLNPFDVEVPIYLSGYNVNIDVNFDSSDYVYNEALWATDIEIINGTPYIHLNVWPLHHLVDMCYDDVKVAIEGLRTRACGTLSAQGCGITVHDDVASDCEEINGYYKCLDMPAIRTMLRADEMILMYPTCGVLPDP